ncbi:hypothetical protein BC826DRAFT_566005 [Russula brevipes]|nr:hypothetical protein BC826DRAFT_566005 [Russula brevipes]
MSDKLNTLRKFAVSDTPVRTGSEQEARERRGIHRPWRLFVCFFRLEHIIYVGGSSGSVVVSHADRGKGGALLPEAVTASGSGGNNPDVAITVVSGHAFRRRVSGWSRGDRETICSSVGNRGMTCMTPVLYPGLPMTSIGGRWTIAPGGPFSQDKHSTRGATGSNFGETQQGSLVPTAKNMAPAALKETLSLPGSLSRRRRRTPFAFTTIFTPISMAPSHLHATRDVDQPMKSKKRKKDAKTESETLHL